MNYPNRPKLDLNVSNYSIPELFEVLEVPITEDKSEVIARADEYINKFTRDDNILLLDFFTKVKEKLNDFFSEEDQQEDIDLILQMETLHQTENKLPYSENLILLRDDDKVDKVKNMEIVPGQLNPRLENTISKILIIDSQFRQILNSETDNSSTNFSIDLSEPLNELISMKMYSIQIPYTWYTIDEKYGTNVFYIDSKKIIIEPGNYTPEELVEEINNTINGEDFDYTQTDESSDSNPYIKFVYNSKNGKISIISTFKTSKRIVFYNNREFGYAKVNNNLGYLMGFREKEYIIGVDTIRGEGIIDLYGPKYLLLVIDDFNQNRINSGVINVYDKQDISLKLPSYFNTSVQRACVDNNVEYVPNNPRQLTQNQLYSLNEIQENRQKTTNNRLNAAVTTDVLALIPIKHGATGSSFIEFGGSLQSNKREYFGPVNVTRLRVRLMDDKGNIVNLNGGNWSFGVICESLYKM